MSAADRFSCITWIPSTPGSRFAPRSGWGVCGWQGPGGWGGRAFPGFSRTQCGRCAWNQRGLARSWETWRIGSPWTPLSAWSSKLGIGLIPRNSPTGTPLSSQLPSAPVPATCCPRISSPTAVTTTCRFSTRSTILHLTLPCSFRFTLRVSHPDCCHGVAALGFYGHAWIRGSWRVVPAVPANPRTGKAAVIEAAHTNVLGARGMGQKTSDLSAIPLCSAHHRENPDSYHRLGEQVFSREHGLALQELVRALRSRFWQQDLSASCTVHPG